MPLNLITDSWILAIRDRERVTIRPDQIAEEGIVRPDWPRADLNLACLELLIGLVFLADPPRDDGEWHERYEKPDSDRLRAALEPFAPHFELSGEGPRFLQDLERFEEGAKQSESSPPDMLFIDSAGESTSKKNADLMVKRGRYGRLPLPLAAMALYTLQAFAPAGGSGNRTSMRGGGPMVTLVQPLDRDTYPLWRLIWLNVPESKENPLSAQCAEEALPWLRPTRTSEQHEIVTPEMSHPAEAFFGMPRRLRLRFAEGVVTGVVQKRYGTNYQGWLHPLSPHYRMKPGEEPLPVHPKPGRVSYRNWLGLNLGQSRETRMLAESVRRYNDMADPPTAELLVGGWAMNNMSPMDFDVHAYPVFRLDESADLRAGGLVEAANGAASALRKELRKGMKTDGNTASAVQETFFTDTEPAFVAAVKRIVDGDEQEVEERWLARLRQATLGLFDNHAIPALASRNLSRIEAVVTARRNLLSAFSKPRGIRDKLELPADDKETAA